MAYVPINISPYIFLLTTQITKKLPNQIVLGTKGMNGLTFLCLLPFFDAIQKLYKYVSFFISNRKKFSILRISIFLWKSVFPI